ncbi:hypothetical protein HDU80_009943 [Chytriomyces hyalinus]|nr:hypothetical protein HDU80_009943 [Chytriomyces hyalinus]
MTVTLAFTALVLAALVAAIPATALSQQQTPFNTSLLPTYYTLAAIAYHKDNVFTAWDCPLCKSPSVSDVINAVYLPTQTPERPEQGYIAVSPSLKTIIFSIDGTDDWDEWINNLKVWKRSWSNLHGCSSNVEVHSGFWNTWMELRGRMEPTLVSYLQAFPSYSVTFVGHSLGGAATLVAAVDLVNRRALSANRAILVSFGQPRVGNIEFAQCVGAMGFKQTARVVNKKDVGPVEYCDPHLPPIFLGYAHHSHEYWIDLYDVLVTNCNDDSGDEADNCSRTLDADLSVPDHVNYYNIALP